MFDHGVPCPPIFIRQPNWRDVQHEVLHERERIHRDGYPRTFSRRTIYGHTHCRPYIGRVKGFRQGDGDGAG